MSKEWVEWAISPANMNLRQSFGEVASLPPVIAARIVCLPRCECRERIDAGIVGSVTVRLFRRPHNHIPPELDSGRGHSAISIFHSIGSSTIPLDAILGLKSSHQHWHQCAGLGGQGQYGIDCGGDDGDPRRW